MLNDIIKKIVTRAKNAYIYHIYIYHQNINCLANKTFFKLRRLTSNEYINSE